MKPSIRSLSLLAEQINAELRKLSASDAIHDAGPAVIEVLQSRPDASVTLAHEKLHAYPFKEVPICWRRVYEEGSLWKVVYLLRKSTETREDRNLDTLITKGVETVDMALILTGAPGRRALLDSVLETLNTADSPKPFWQDRAESDDEVDTSLPRKRRKVLGESQTCAASQTTSDGEVIPATFTPNSPYPAIELVNPVTSLSRPSLTAFQKHMTTSPTPIVLKDIIAHWPALSHWKSPRYWDRITHNGRRLVPIELGSSYTDNDWSQKIIPFGEYMRNHLLPSRVSKSQHVTPPKPHQKKGYLAQHDLLSQIPALRRDISIPDYCFLSPTPTQSQDPGSDSDSDSSPPDPALNIWLGPAHTTSPAHTDPHHNILAQVFGRKYVRLFAPAETARLYPMGSSGAVDMGNTSRVDVGLAVPLRAESDDDDDDEVQERERARQRSEFPLFEAASYVEAVLEPGECLYIPRGWWHYVRSLDVSCSVSFWWD